MSVEQKYAAQNMAAVNNLLTPEMARHVWVAIASLVGAARDAEHSAYLLIAASAGNTVEAAEFSQGMRDSLIKVHEQLKFVGGVLNGGA